MVYNMGFAQKEKKIQLTWILSVSFSDLLSSIFPLVATFYLAKFPGSLWRQYDSVKDFKACKAFIRKK